MRRLPLLLSFALAAPSTALFPRPASAQGAASDAPAENPPAEPKQAPPSEPGTSAPAPSPETPAPPAPVGEEAPAGDMDEEDIEEDEVETSPDAPKGTSPVEGTSGSAEGELGEDEMEGLEGEGVDVNEPPAKGKGAVWGVISESEFGETLIEAQVQVIGTKHEAITDMDGRFRLELPPGTYSLRITYELHKTIRVDGVVVAEGRIARLDAKLDPDEGAVDAVEIVEEANKSSLEGVILARQRATVVGDNIGRTEITKTPDRNAAQAAQRVVGATIVGGRFVFVRGLGERYSNALLNGVPLPSPEPDRAAVPLDLFPTGVLNSLTIAKTFTPDVPGDFAGGSVRIETREIPSEPTLQLSLSSGFNTDATFRDRLSYRGGSLDWLGLDDGTRALPDGFPNYKQTPGGQRPDGSLIDEAELVRSGRALNAYMSPTTVGTPPEHGISVVGGNSFKLGGDQKLGLLGSLNYGRSYVVREDEIRREFRRDTSVAEGFRYVRDYRVDTGSENVGWGGFASLSYRPASNHQISLLGMRTTIAENYAQRYEGRHESRNLDIYATKLALVTRALNLGQLRGEHSFEKLSFGRLDWYLSLSAATRDQPDTRDVVWGKSPGRDFYNYTVASDAGRHFYSEQGENQYGGGLDWTQPITTGKLESSLKFGGSVSVRDRDFEARSLRFDREARASDPLLVCSENVDDCTDRLFRDANIGPIIGLDESTQLQDAYNAKLDVFAGYLMADLKPWEKVRIVLGQRFEYTHQLIDPYDQFGQGTPPEGANIKQTDLLPALSASWNFVPKATLRAALSRTIARPQLRELAPFSFADFFGGRITAGQPELELTRITNVDFRVEYFPTLREVLAFSLFFKHFEKPIEPILFDSGDLGLLTFQNAQGADLIGFELEARKGLDFVHAALSDFSAVANVTVAQSKIYLEEGSSLIVTNASRPLVNQAPFVLNLALDYTNEDLGSSARVLFNVVGPRITEVGSEGLPDVYEHPRGMFDLTFQQKFFERLSARLAIRNLLNSAVVFSHGCNNDGVFGSTWRFSCDADDEATVRKYTEGTGITLSASYDFE